MFMFSFYARGMAFIDLAYLTKENIQGEYIIYRRHKTGQELSIKLEICLKTIIDRYSHYSWATLAKKKGISTQIISESMGHNSEKTTRIYLSSLDRSVIDDANAKLISGI